MTITLAVGATTLALDPDLQWADEYTWAATEQSVSRSLTGALLVQVGQRQAGRPITLVASDSSGWMSRAAMAQLQAWADIPGQVMTLGLRGISYAVMFRHHDSGPFDARPLVDYSDPADSDWVVPTIRFMTVTG